MHQNSWCTQANEKAGCPGSPLWFKLEAFHSIHGSSQLSLKWGWHSAHPQICNICPTGSVTPLEIDHTSYSQTKPQRADLTLETSNDYIIQSLLFCLETLAHLMWLTNKQWPGRGSVWEISVTLTSEWRPGGEEKASMWMSGLWEVPGKSRVLTHTAERHSPALIGSRYSQILSWLLPGKKKGYKNSEQNSERGWVRRGEEGRGMWVWGGVVGEER